MIAHYSVVVMGKNLEIKKYESLVDDIIRSASLANLYTNFGHKGEFYDYS